MPRLRMLQCVMVVATGLVASLLPAFVEGPQQQEKLERLHFSTQFVLQAVADHLGVPLQADFQVPTVFLSSQSAIGPYQDAAYAQWQFRPPKFVNSYLSVSNEIYLDDGVHSPSNVRTLDDSLAHELTHYIQDVYFYDHSGSDASEEQAVEVQTWFRLTYM